MVNREGCCRPFVLARLALLTVLLSAGSVPGFAITLTVTGGGSFSIGAADLTGGAGSDLAPNYRSADDAMLISVADTTLSDWQIQVRVEEVLWHGGLDLGVLRTGNGSGTGSVTGGDVLPVSLTSVDQVFFEGSGDMADIPVRLDLSGVSVLIPVDAYSATLYFTVVEIP